MNPSTPKIPISILTGFLGSGKTSLLNNLVEKSNLRLALIINEFGNIGIDGDLVCDAENQILELNNGCLCCTVKGDLTKILLDLHERRSDIDHIIIETTGMANPAPVSELICFDPQVNHLFEMDGIITMIDSCNIMKSSHCPEVEAQLIYADLLVFNKLDLMDDLSEIESFVKSFNPTAKTLKTQFGAIPNLQQVFNLKQDNQLPKFEHHTHQHNTKITSVSISFEGQIDEAKFRYWMGGLLFDSDMTFYRIKGIVNVFGRSKLLVFQSVHRLYEDFTLKKAISQELNRAVFIGEKLDEKSLEQGFKSCLVSS